MDKRTDIKRFQQKVMMVIIDRPDVRKEKCQSCIPWFRLNTVLLNQPPSCMEYQINT